MKTNTTQYRIQAKTITTPWCNEGSGDVWESREAAERAAKTLEATNDDGDAIEYRVVGSGGEHR